MLERDLEMMRSSSSRTIAIPPPGTHGLIESRVTLAVRIPGYLAREFDAVITTLRRALPRVLAQANCTCPIPSRTLSLASRMINCISGYPDEELGQLPAAEWHCRLVITPRILEDIEHLRLQYHSLADGADHVLPNRVWTLKGVILLRFVSDYMAGVSHYIIVTSYDLTCYPLGFRDNNDSQLWPTSLLELASVSGQAIARTVAPPGLIGIIHEACGVVGRSLLPLVASAPSDTKED